MNNIKTRTEKDSLGTVKVPKDAYFGSFTKRAMNNFQISDLKAPEIFINALGIVKLAAAKSNSDLGLIENKLAAPIKRACQEFLNLKFIDEFNIDVYQAGAGTSYNMNANEIIANRANEILGGKKGEYKFIHPNNHVNLAQSSNDVIPTATRIAILSSLPDLFDEVQKTINELSKISRENRKTIKVGRTHLQDAVPICFSQVFDSYKEAISKSNDMINRESETLKILGIGGTAVGTGINTDPKYRKLMIYHLSKIVGIRFKSSQNLTEISNNMNVFLNFSAALRSLATNLINLVNDLKLMSMGPRAGINELILPKVQPGSSIMPGKINPSIPESLEMVCYQVLGNDKTIELAAQRSQLELNVMCPLITQNILFSIKILTNGLKTLSDLCLKKLKINKKRSKELFEKSLCTGTIFALYLGYNPTAEIVKSALKKNKTIKDELLSRNIFTKKELDELLSINSITKPKEINKKLIKKSL